MNTPTAAFDKLLDADTPRERMVSVITVEDRLAMLDRMTIEELKSVIADCEVQPVVREVAESNLKLLQACTRLAKIQMRGGVQ